VIQTMTKSVHPACPAMVSGQFLESDKDFLITVIQSSKLIRSHHFPVSCSRVLKSCDKMLTFEGSVEQDMMSAIKQLFVEEAKYRSGSRSNRLPGGFYVDWFLDFDV
jgi:hypothetical protein